MPAFVGPAGVGMSTFTEIVCENLKWTSEQISVGKTGLDVMQRRFQ